MGVELDFGGKVSDRMNILGNQQTAQRSAQRVLGCPAGPSRCIALRMQSHFNKEPGICEEYCDMKSSGTRVLSDWMRDARRTGIIDGDYVCQKSWASQQSLKLLSSTSRGHMKPHQQVGVAYQKRKSTHFACAAHGGRQSEQRALQVWQGNPTFMDGQVVHKWMPAPVDRRRFW